MRGAWGFSAQCGSRLWRGRLAYVICRGPRHLSVVPRERRPSERELVGYLAKLLLRLNRLLPDRVFDRIATGGFDRPAEETNPARRT
jgi:hypothetical protein